MTDAVRSIVMKAKGNIGGTLETNANERNKEPVDAREEQERRQICPLESTRGSYKELEHIPTERVKQSTVVSIHARGSGK